MIFVYYNKWTKWKANSKKEYSNKWFSRITLKEFNYLKKGDKLWINEDPMSMSGKVYGYRQIEITRVDGNKKYFDGGGFTTIGSNLYKCRNEIKVFKFIQANPETQVI